MADPDLKDISKQAIDVLKNASQIFADQLFQKCFEESKDKKRVTANVNDFEDAVRTDPVLNAMLEQFFVDKNEIEEEEVSSDSENEKENSSNNDEDSVEE